MLDYQGKNFKDFLKKNGVSVIEASKKLGVSRNTVYQYFASENLSRETVINIITSFEVEESLIFPKKDAFGKIEARPTRLMDPEKHEAGVDKFYELADGSIIMQVPIIPQRAYAGYMRGFSDPEFYEDLTTIPVPVDKKHKGNYLGFEVSGNSMVCYDTEELAERSIWPGRIAIGRELSKHQWQYKLHTHNYDAWIIVHRTEGVIIKEIVDQCLDKGEITVHSLNPEYEDQVLKLDEIDQIFNVVQIIKK
jgi:transcriptional regulator with XRE-family HTH domain